MVEDLYPLLPKHISAIYECTYHNLYYQLISWVRKIKVPLFSIDYRLAPKAPFPYPLDDCWQAYKYLVENVERLYGITPKQILLTGDSAGGQLVLGKSQATYGLTTSPALTLWLIKIGYRKPDILFPVYPAINLDISQMTPSMVMSLEDPLLCVKLLLRFSEHYMPDRT